MKYPTQEWLEELSPGRLVAVTLGYQHSNCSLAVVNSVTKKFIRVTIGRQVVQFRRDTGRQTGEHGSYWRILDPNDDRVILGIAKQDARRLYGEMRDIPEEMCEEFNEFAGDFVRRIKELKKGEQPK